MFARGFKTWCENTAASLRREFGLKAVDPLDPYRLADWLGVLVWPADRVPGVDRLCLRILLEEDPWSWSAVTVHANGKSAIILNSAHSGGRASSNLAHELAHVVLGHDPARVDISEDGTLLLHTYERSQEEEASWLAGSLLVPRSALLHAQEQVWVLEETAKHYGVSQDLVDYRLKVTGVDKQIARRRLSSRRPRSP